MFGTHTQTESVFLVVPGVKCKRWCFSAAPLWKLQRCGPAGPRSSSGGHQQRSCRDQRQVWNSPGKLPDRLTKGRVCFPWEEKEAEGVRKGYPWVEEPRWAGGLINLLKKSNQCETILPVPGRRSTACGGEWEITESVTHDKTGQTSGKKEDKDVCILQAVTVKQRLNPRVNIIRTWCIYTPPPPVRCFEWRIYPLAFILEG